MGWIWKINWRGCERKRSCPNSMCCPVIYRERLVKITKNSESWTEPGTSRIQSRLTTLPTDRRVRQAAVWEFTFSRRKLKLRHVCSVLVSRTMLWLAVRRSGVDSGSVWAWVLSQGWTNVGHIQDLYFETHVPTRVWILVSIHELPPDALYIRGFDSSLWKPAGLRLLAWSYVSVRPSFRV